MLALLLATATLAASPIPDETRQLVLAVSPGWEATTATFVCVDDPGSPHYNSLADLRETAKHWSSAEEMRRADELYRLVVWVAHNDRPVEAGAGSCNFLHLRASAASVTAGCTAFEPAAMGRLLRWLDPAARPVLVQLPAAEQRARAAAWGLPDQGSAAER